MPKLEKSTSRTCWARQLVSFAALSEITTSHWSRAVISQTNDSWSLSWGVDCILEINKEQFKQLVDSELYESNDIFLVICSEVVVFVVAKIFLQLIPLRTLLRVMLLEVTMATAIMN